MMSIPQGRLDSWFYVHHLKFQFLWMHEDFVSYDVLDPTDGSLFGFSTFYSETSSLQLPQRKSSDRQKVGILRSLTNPFETTTFRTLVGTLLSQDQDEGSSLRRRKFLGAIMFLPTSLGPVGRVFDLSITLRVYSRLQNRLPLFCTRQILFLPTYL